MPAANILGQAYSFADAKLTIAGIECFSVSNIVMTVTQEKTNNYGSGTRPVSRGRGTKQYEASFDLSLKDTERLKVLVATNDLTDLEPTSAILLLDNGIDGKHEWTAVYFEFTDDGVEAAQDDSEMKRTFGGMMSDLVSVKLS